MNSVDNPFMPLIGATSRQVEAIIEANGSPDTAAVAQSQTASETGGARKREAKAIELDMNWMLLLDTPQSVDEKSRGHEVRVVDKVEQYRLWRARQFSFYKPTTVALIEANHNL